MPREKLKPFVRRSQSATSDEHISQHASCSLTRFVLSMHGPMRLSLRLWLLPWFHAQAGAISDVRWFCRDLGSRTLYSRGTLLISCRACYLYHSVELAGDSTMVPLWWVGIAGPFLLSSSGLLQVRVAHTNPVMSIRWFVTNLP